MAERVLADESTRAHVIAKAFHETYERLAPNFGITREIAPRDWDEVPQMNKELMIAVVAELLYNGTIQVPFSNETVETLRDPANDPNLKD